MTLLLAFNAIIHFILILSTRHADSVQTIIIALQPQKYKKNNLDMSQTAYHQMLQEETHNKSINTGRR